MKSPQTSRRSASKSLALRFVQLLAVAPLAVGLAGLLLSPRVGAQLRDSGDGTAAATNPNTYTLSAQANALDVLVTDPSLPLSGDLAVEAGPWGASALVNSLGESMSDAGAPYSPSVASLPGTVNGLGGGSVPPLPPIPGYVSAAYPNRPTSSQTQAGYQLTSTASANTAKGAVSLGVQPSGSPNPTFFANAQTTANSDGSVSVAASAGMDALDFGQLFDLGNVSTSMSMTQQAGQQPAVTTQTNLGQITLLGKASGLGTKGLSVLGIGTPINLNTQLLSVLNSVLGKAGLKFTYLPETFIYNDGTSSTGSTPESTKTVQSVDSGALQISESENIPSQGQTSVTLTLGHITVSTTDAPGILPTATGGIGDITGGTTGINNGTPLTTPVSSANGFTGGGLPLTSSPTSVPVTTGTNPSPSRPLANSTTYAVELGPAIRSVYLLLVLAALAMLIVVPKQFAIWPSASSCPERAMDGCGHEPAQLKRRES